MSDRDVLLDMGFTPTRVDLALRASGNSGLQSALDWLEAHADDPSVEEQAGKEAKDGEAETAEDAGELKEGEEGTAQSLLCTDCGRRFRD
ncbi:hypothetical protein THASP1DRAFT_32390, partial [Thamnocephalis sphaerospora]